MPPPSPPSAGRARRPAKPRAAPAVAEPGLPAVELYTDGACSGNPGPGGWAFLLRHPASGKHLERWGGEAETTNNRMELRAVIEGLSALTRRSRVEVYSDSQYVLKGLDEWLEGWKAKGWKTAGKQPVKNIELWKALDALRADHALTYHWVRGHNEHPENERCDALAVMARERVARGLDPSGDDALD
ncbi:MAG: ribonuclease HI [Phycisphaerales bacterium]|nr:ribonuclease HI [Phycisphaerales bacterium]